MFQKSSPALFSGETAVGTKDLNLNDEQVTAIWEPPALEV